MITAAHVLKPCYIEDDQTVSKTGTGSSVAVLSSAWTMKASRWRWASA